MIKYIKELLKRKKEKQFVIPVVSKRFDFGEKLKVNGKEYRYLYTNGNNDVFFDEEAIVIYLIDSKYIVDD